ncbi:MAG: geranylgeranylglyceryl/heptaprenylglyceryl phosphate synthase [Candidatus Heimdallarchaeaceae archaeon]
MIKLKSKVWRYITEKLQDKKVLHFTLIDPDPIKQTPDKAGYIAKIAEEAGSSAIMVGGSTAFGILDDTIISIKENTSIPVILFPGNINGISKHADAIFFMSLLNSRNPYWIIQVHMLAAPIVKTYNLEAIPMGYLIFQPGGSAGFVGDVNLLPRNKPEIAAAYALAAQYLGFKLVYFESGSGASSPIPAKIISETKKILEIPLIVGGGISAADDAINLAKAGADIIVQGTFVEQCAFKDRGMKLKKIINALTSSKKQHEK